MPLFETCSLRDPTAQVADAAGAVQARQPNHPWIHPAARSFFMDRTSPYIFLYEDTQQPYCASSTAWFLPSLTVHILNISPLFVLIIFWVGRGGGGGRVCKELGGLGLCDLRRQTASTGRWFLAEASVRPGGSVAPLRFHCPGSRRFWCGKRGKEKAKPSISPQPDG